MIPVGSAALALLLLGEALAPYHLVGAALVAGGITLGSRGRLAQGQRTTQGSLAAKAR